MKPLGPAAGRPAGLQQPSLSKPGWCCAARPSCASPPPAPRSRGTVGCRCTSGQAGQACGAQAKLSLFTTTFLKSLRSDDQGVFGKGDPEVPSSTPSVSSPYCRRPFKPHPGRAPSRRPRPEPVRRSSSCRRRPPARRGGPGRGGGRTIGAGCGRRAAGAGLGRVPLS